MDRRWILLSTGLLIGCRPAVTVVEPPAPMQVDTTFGRLPLLVKDIPAGEISVLEGLPSPFWEPEGREREAQSKPTITVEGYLFYDEAVELTDKDAVTLTELFGASDSYRPYRDQKACGEFHPDYCLAWESESGTTHALVSLECAEVILVGPQGGLRCDLRPEAAQRLEAVLSSYQIHRPLEDSIP
jgi:hypothetical protein